MGSVVDRQMIIELLFLNDELAAQGDHLRLCSDKRCDDIAHLYERLTVRYAGQAEVFAFMAGTARGHQYRLNHARARAEREAPLLSALGTTSE